MYIVIIETNQTVYRSVSASEIPEVTCMAQENMF